MARRPKSTAPAASDAAPAAFRMEKNPSVCLVYDVYDAKGRALSREQVSKTYQAEARTAWKRRKPAAHAGPRLCGDGDSWVNILWPFSAVLGHQKTFFDVLEGKYYTADVAYPGDTFERMLVDKDYRPLIQSGSFDFFIFSGGGNDVLGGGALVELLRWKEEGAGSPDPRKYLVGPLLKRKLDRLRDGYMEIADDVKARSSGKTRMLVHGYDYPVPRADGVWIGKPLQAKGYDLRTDRQLVADILRHLVDQLYATLDAVQRRKRNVTLVNLRGVCAGRWNDELHPRNAASADIAAKFSGIIDEGSA